MSLTLFWGGPKMVWTV